MDIDGKEFKILPLTRKQRRELLRKYDFDFVDFVMGVINSAKDGEEDFDININTNQLDAVLDVCFPGMDKELDEIGFSGQIKLFQAVMAAHCNFKPVDDEEIKN